MATTAYCTSGQSIHGMKASVALDAALDAELLERQQRTRRQHHTEPPR